MIFLFCLRLIACEDIFDLKQYKDMELLVSYADGQFGDKQFSLHAKSDCVVQNNGTFKCFIKSGKVVGNPIYSFNIDDSTIEVLDEFSDNIANLNLRFFDNMTCHFNGKTNDDKHYISGQFSAIDEALVMSISDVEDDGVYLITGKMPQKMTACLALGSCLFLISDFLILFLYFALSKEIANQSAD